MKLISCLVFETNIVFMFFALMLFGTPPLVVVLSRYAGYGYNASCVPDSVQTPQEVLLPPVHLCLPRHPRKCESGCHPGVRTGIPGHRGRLLGTWDWNYHISGGSRFRYLVSIPSEYPGLLETCNSGKSYFNSIFIKDGNLVFNPSPQKSLSFR